MTTVLVVVAILGAMVIVPRLATRASVDKRDEITVKLQPLDSALTAYRLDILRVSAEARAYAATRNPASRMRFNEAELRLDAEAPQLLAIATDVGFREGAADLISLGDEYRDVGDRIVAAEDAGDDFESFRLIDQEGAPKLVAIDTAGNALADAIEARRNELREQISDVEQREQAAILAAAVLGAIAAIVLGVLIINNARLGRRLDAERRRLDDVVGDVPGVVWEAWGKPDAASQQIDFVSAYVEEMLGYSREEWLATPNFWLTIVHPDDREAAAEEAGDNFARGGKGSNRFRWVAKDGRSVWVLSHSTVIADERGMPVGMRGVTVDVTDTRRAEEAAERERARFASMIASVDYGVYQIDERGCVLYVNPAAEQILGYSMEELAGREAHPIFHQTRHDGTPYPSDECPMVQTARGAATYRGVETFTTRFGAPIPAEVTCAAVIVDGRSTGAVVVFQDISARLRRERLKDDFVGFASHELRNPLTSIKGFSRWLASRVQAQPATFDADAQDAIHTLVEEADRMESIINLFLDLARIDSDRLLVDLEPVNLSRLLDDECVRLRQRYPATTCDTALPRDAVIAMLDDDRMRQVVSNLLDNASKYAGTEAKVEVALSDEEAGWATVRISDNGPGIPLDDQPHIFDRYFRGREDQASPRKGLGVGLFISKNLVDRLGGTLVFNSVPGKGTEFVLRLPLAALEVDEESPEEVAESTT